MTPSYYTAMTVCETCRMNALTVLSAQEHIEICQSEWGVFVSFVKRGTAKVIPQVHCQSANHISMHAEAAAAALDAERAAKAAGDLAGKEGIRADGDENEHHQQRHHIYEAEVKHRNKRDKENEHEMQDNIAEMAESDCWA